MSVIVKGMDYPDNCCVCKIKSWDIESYVCPFSGVDTLSIGRQTNCPLRPLPEKHGRLKDVDAIIEDIRKNSESYFADDFAHEWIERQPTIVEAEG